MSAQTFSNVVVGSTTFQEFRQNYNNVASEMNTGVLRLNGPAIVGNVTLNGSATFSQPLEIVSTFTINNATYQQNTANRLENRGGILFFDGKRLKSPTNISATYGYTLGGNQSGSVTTNADRVTFSTSVTAAHTPANASQARQGFSGFSGGSAAVSAYGYATGGSTTTGSAQVATTDRITFSTSTTAAHTPANLTQAREFMACLSDRASYGYALGGLSSGGYSAVTDRIGFSAGISAAQTTANLSQARERQWGSSDGVVYGYVFGGSTTNNVTTADRLTFSTSTTAAYTPANLTQARRTATGISDAGTYGYIAGGFLAAVTDTMERITYSSGITAALTTVLSTARSTVNGMSDGNLYGYVLGGNNSGGTTLATADRITFSSGAVAAHTPANLSAGRQGVAALADYAV